ncbi:hypothetical protein AMK16_24315 [Streptomyces sp. CB00455]|uniref:hypothetical protein n=1 Tax=Streptomyces sp. CB00455 TaxID=1703927 RepID=UPI00093EBF59|nr:hypothetical protein [Streptomyces sp. CB00455]OKK16822.1 hypothetical protein AMK16_24315 [Streptomyces sp. CB00455]
MNWWAASRNVLTLAAVTVVTAGAGLAFGQSRIPVPAMVGGAGQFLLAALITVIPAVTWLAFTGRARDATETVAVRAVHRFDTALAAACATLALSMAVLGHFAGADAVALAIGRNTAFYLGLALILNPLTGARIAAPVVTAIPLVLAVGGWKSGGRGAQPWAVVLHPALSMPALLAGVAVLVAGATFSSLRPPRGAL